MISVQRSNEESRKLRAAHGSGQILSCYKYSINTLVSFTKKYQYEGKNQKSINLFILVAFSKFLTGRRGSRQLLDTDGYTYNERKERTTAEGLSTWRCSKNRSKKCPCVVYFCSSDESLNTGPREHNHPA
ncbi:hypothetical protein ACHWQZ_G007541 [Mnemiopsis leidyi]